MSENSNSFFSEEYLSELAEHLEKLYDNLEIPIYGKMINYRVYEKRYYKAVSNWMINIVPNYLTKDGINITEFREKMSDENFSEIVHISEFYSHVIPFSTCKEIFAKMYETNQYPWEIIVELGLLDDNNLDIEAIIQESISKNPAQLEKYKKGNLGMKNFFIGDIMKNYKNKINQKDLSEKLDYILSSM